MLKTKLINMSQLLSECTIKIKIWSAINAVKF